MKNIILRSNFTIFCCWIGFSATGFYSSAIIYGAFAMFSWFAPSIMVILGLKVTMFLGALTYPALVASFFYLNDYLYYSASALIGIGAAILWTAQVCSCAYDQGRI